MKLYNIVWADDEVDDILVEDVIEDLKEQQVNIVGTARNGEKLQQIMHDKITEIDAVIVDANFDADSNKPEDERVISGLRRAFELHRMYNEREHRNIPFYLYTARKKSILLGNEKFDKDDIRTMRKLFEDPQRWFEKDEPISRVVTKIKMDVDEINTPEFQLRQKYAPEISICPKYATSIIKVASVIKANITNDETVFNMMRDILEWITKYGREHGIFSKEVATPANASTFIQMIKDAEKVPSYVRSTFVALNEVVQNGSHGDDAGEAIKVKEAVRKNQAPHLIRSTFENLMVILDWCTTLPLDESAIAQWREYADTIKLKLDPIKGTIEQDTEGNYYCKETDGNRCCLINKKYVIENNLEKQYVCISAMIANNAYPDESPYPYYTGKNIRII